MMEPKKYSTHFAKLSNLILSMSEEQQAKLVDLACRLQNEENLVVITVLTDGKIPAFISRREF